MTHPECYHRSPEIIQTELVDALDALLDDSVVCEIAPIHSITVTNGLRTRQTTTREIGEEHIGVSLTRVVSWTSFGGRRIVNDSRYSIIFHEVTGEDAAGNPVVRQDQVRFVKGQPGKNGTGALLRAQKRLAMATAHHLALTEPLVYIDPLLEAVEQV